MTKSFKSYLKEASIGAPDYNPAKASSGGPGYASMPQQVKLAGDSMWDKDGSNPEMVTITDYEVSEEGDYVSVTVEHDGPWTVYTDSGFEKAVSDMIGMDVEFSEQGMQEDGRAHLEGSSEMESTNEAVGDAAAPIYDLIDELGSHQVVMDELIRFLDVDQIEEFVADFRRHHDMKEADVEENAFNQAAAAAARAGKDEFEFGGKTHKTTMKKDTAHKLSDEVDYLKKLAGL